MSKTGTTMDYRGEARNSLARVKQNLNDHDSNHTRYAALDLRIALESLIYERAGLYSEELCGKKLSTWQPGKLLTILLEIDPFADKGGEMSVGTEEEYGKSAPAMHSLGRERTLSLKEIKTYYDRLGSYLHAPTREQVSSGKVATPERMTECCAELLTILEEVLYSPVFNLNFRVKSEITCGKCGEKILRRLPPGGGTVVANCINCSAQYNVTFEGAGDAVWTPLLQSIKCANEHCDESIDLWESDIKEGAKWTCSGCNRKNIISLALVLES